MIRMTIDTKPIGRTTPGSRRENTATTGNMRKTHIPGGTGNFAAEP